MSASAPLDSPSHDSPSRRTGAAGSAPPSTASQRLLARLAFAFAALAVLSLVIGAGPKGIGTLLLSLAAPAVIAASVYWFLRSRGPVRWVAAAIAVLTPVLLVIAYVRADLVSDVILALVLSVLCIVCGAAALRPDVKPHPPVEHDTPPPARPFFIMNPRSGGGKVERFGLASRAKELGAEVALLDGPGEIDVAALAADAVARGADLLGVAGGDGTQALVAGIAAQHGLPFLVISAGTRNHFALDLGLDREDPSRCLDALTDGVEVLIDLGRINGRTFVNNASFGAYADVVQSPQYRDHKTRTTLSELPDLMMARRGARLSVQVDGAAIDQPQAVLISNNPYGGSDLSGMGRRPRLDLGTLGIIGVSVRSTRQAIGLLRRTSRHGLTRAESPEVTVTADTESISVGVDGEALTMTVPVRCQSMPGALRVRVPRHRPGVPSPRPRLDWVRLRQLAGPAHPPESA